MNEISFVLKSPDFPNSLEFHPMSVTICTRASSYHMMGYVAFVDETHFVVRDPVIVKLEGEASVRYMKPFAFSDDRYVLYRREDATNIVSLAERWEKQYAGFVKDLYETRVEEEIENDADDGEEEPKQPEVLIKRTPTLQ